MKQTKKKIKSWMLAAFLLVIGLPAGAEEAPVLGKWNVRLLYEIECQGEMVDIDVKEFSVVYEFRRDGSGSLLNDNELEVIVWEYDENKQILQIRFVGGGGGVYISAPDEDTNVAIEIDGLTSYITLWQKIQ